MATLQVSGTPVTPQRDTIPLQVGFPSQPLLSSAATSEFQRPHQLASATHVLLAPMACPHAVAPTPTYAGSLPRDALLAEGFARLEERRQNPTSRDRAYMSLLQELEAKGVFEGLPLSDAGVLRVAAPFCGGFSETPLLLPYLMERVALGRPGGAGGLQVRASDLEVCRGWWETFAEWTSRNLGPHVSLHFQQLDLQRNPLPLSDLIIAVHPRATLFGPWHDILANVLRGRTTGGRCVFATFYDTEAKAVEIICDRAGFGVDIYENPYYAGQPTNSEGNSEPTQLRYAIVVRS